MHRPVIVICDDETELVNELAEWFEFQGWAVYKASNADEALQLLNNAPATCLVTDRLMPHAGGEALAQWVSALPDSRRPRFVGVMTGDFSVEGLPRPGGVDVVFMKPVDPREMLMAIVERLTSRLPIGRYPQLAAPVLAGGSL
jgi:CheY-like chemotaxis protein